jgi:hypothetical protein
MAFVSGSAHHNFKHGMSRNPAYQSWIGMINRCTDSTHKQYKDYGGRGITVIALWMESFPAFLEDMGERPKGCSIDRIDCNGNYSPENCRWAPLKQQARNTRRNKFLEFNGESRTVSEWAEITGNDPIVIGKRLRRGWSVEEALTTPRLLTGHRSERTELQSAILGILEGGPGRCAEIAKTLMKPAPAVHSSLTVMMEQGIVVRMGRGIFAATGHEPISGFQATDSTFAMNARNAKCPSCKWVGRRATSACRCESGQGVSCGCRWGMCSKCGDVMILSELYWYAIRGKRDVGSWFESDEARSLLAEMLSTLISQSNDSLPLTRDR